MKYRFSRALPFIITLIILVYICSIGIKNIFRYNKFKLEYRLLNAQLTKEKQRNIQLKQRLTMLKKPFFWEMIAKQKLGYIKKGETVYKIIRSQK